ncbi:MAG: BrnT family toxin [Candidatus Lambdaproteobacteria bacterium]|nr:BrnT family toxin [Candidatus Lambdaproteobacteria bacterium]
MRIEFDLAKRTITLKNRGLDFRDAEHVLAGEQFTFQDLRQDYGEPRFITIGYLDERIVVIGWTPRKHDGETVCRVFSMRKASEKEIARFQERLR